MQVLSYFGFFKVLKVTATSSRLLAIGSLSLFIWHLASGNWHLKTVRDYKCWQKDRFTTNPSCNSFKTLNAESQTLQLSFHKPLSQKGGETASASLNEFFSILIVSVFYHIKHQYTLNILFRKIYKSSTRSPSCVIAGLWQTDGGGGSKATCAQTLHTKTLTPFVTLNPIDPSSTTYNAACTQNFTRENFNSIWDLKSIWSLVYYI